MVKLWALIRNKKFHKVLSIPTWPFITCNTNFRGDIEKYRSDKAEFIVEEALSKIMAKKPGLLKRGLNCHKRSFPYLKNIIGNIPPLYCKCRSEDGVCKLENQCYHMESDLILVNPNENKIYIILIEVKRINGEL